jgi:hypothetical protein
MGGMEVLHNVAVLNIFFVGMQHTLSEQPKQFAEEIMWFKKMYDGKLGMFAESISK